MRPIFIGGFGRSGTSVLRRIVGESPDVAVLPHELRILTEPDGVLDLWEAIRPKAWTPYRATIAWDRFLALLQHRWDALTDIRPSAAINESLDHVRSILTGREVGWTFDHPYRRSATARWVPIAPRYRSVNDYPEIRKRLAKFVEDFFVYGRRVRAWVEDTPENCLRVSTLRELFPDATFVFAARHPLDVIASQGSIAPKWWPNDWNALAENLREYEIRVLTHFDESNPTVHLEKLVDDPEFVTKDLCIRLDIAWSESMVNVVGDAHVGRWREDLPPSRVKALWQRLEPTAQALGYCAPEDL